MTSNVGLTTPRGSGTSGYIQRNLSTLRPRDSGFGAPYRPLLPPPPPPRQPDAAILQHDRLRELEVAVLELRDELEEGGEGQQQLDEEEVERRCDELRQRLLGDMERGGGGGGGRHQGGMRKVLKPYQVHELAEAKERESERFRGALGIRERRGEGDEGGRERGGDREKERGERKGGRRWGARERDGERDGDGDREGNRERERERERDRRRDGKRD